MDAHILSAEQTKKFVLHLRVEKNDCEAAMKRLTNHPFIIIFAIA
jgi:hypothetical protein